MLLVGLDALHRLIDAFSGARLITPLIARHFTPVIVQLDARLEASVADAELAALWLLSPLRLAKLYQLRCLANLPSCAQDQQVRRGRRDAGL